MGSDSTKRTGIGFLSLLGLLFIGLKLACFIDWAWWVVLAPIWIQPAVFLALIVFIGIVEVFDSRGRKNS